ncbi:hypothetical protein I5L01_04435 [Erythrobacter sp. YJ-T3-07]|uniref:hypothetical protein n=1 Tax=Erythrobacter sp. YJ-T3-07 TaxID=2793063 RepID=UPI0018D2C156|nr:hypothetical protein [Erythrobacter sp. YJ-T3-07]MBH1943476.1 hypothetical protein [Erythrobacter sp. YJ-T3-07]
MTIDPATMLSLYPKFLQLRLLGDESLRDALGVEIGETITIEGAVSFDRTLLNAAIEGAYAGEGDGASVQDMDGEEWSLSLDSTRSPPAVRLSKEESAYLLVGLAWLLPKASDRLHHLEGLRRELAIGVAALAPWREILARRTLNLPEIDALQEVIDRSPMSRARKIAADVTKGKGDLETFAPGSAESYAPFVGSDPASDLASFRDGMLPGIVRAWLDWDQFEGAKMALLGCGQGSLAPATELRDLPGDHLVRLAEWGLEGADLLSKVAIIEVGLPSIRRVPDLTGPLSRLVEQIRDMEPKSEGSRAKLLMASLITVEAELSRTQALAHLPPFQRRIAALAHASLFDRTAHHRVDTDGFAKWALEARGRHFYLQELVDLRSEPRWHPEGATAERLDAELMGRIRNAAWANTDSIAGTELEELLMGSGGRSISSRVQFPGSFLPGPAEGAYDAAPSPPQEFEEILDQSLADRELTPRSVIALVNLSAMFRIGDERIDRAVELVRAAGYHFSADVGTDERDLLIDGLAKVAAGTRRADLARDVRIMLRRLRVDGSAPLPATREFLTCVTAAAAHGNLAEWADFVGDCAIEAANSIASEDEARLLHFDLERLCQCEPLVRARGGGRALATLQLTLKE